MALNPALFFVSSIFFIISSLFFFFGFRQLKMKRLIENTPTSKVRSIAMGLCEISGTVVAYKKLISPLTRKECVYYAYQIQELRKEKDKEGKETSNWVTISSGINSVPFYIKDETGAVIVNPEKAQVQVNEKFTLDANSPDDIPKSIQEFLSTDTINQKRKNSSFRLTIGNFKISSGEKFRNLSFSESYISPGDNLFIIGSATNNPLAQNALASNQKIIIAKGTSRIPFIISGRSEKEILKGMNLQVKLFLFGAPIIMSVSLYLILKGFGVI